LKVDKKYIFIILFISCSSHQKNITIDFSKLRKINPIIDEAGWKVVKTEKWSNTIEYTLQKKEKDTNELLVFQKLLYDSIFNPGDVKYGLVIFQKKFKDKKFGYVVSFGSDTNYYYKYYLDRPDSMIFIVGKYLYLAYYHKLSKVQKMYFFAHKDSLKKIRGNDLPDLPNERKK